MSAHGYCAHCRTGAGVVSALLEPAADEPVATAAAGAFDPFGPESPERVAIEAVLSELRPAGARP
jgi:hypothetical protein